MVDCGIVMILKVILRKVSLLHYNLSHYIIMIEFLCYNGRVALLLVSVLLNNDGVTYKFYGGDSFKFSHIKCNLDVAIKRMITLEDVNPMDVAYELSILKLSYPFNVTSVNYFICP